MPTVKLKVTRWLRQSLGGEPAVAGEISISIPEGETILEMLGRLASERGGPWKTLVGRETLVVGENLLVVLNGCLVNPHNRSEATLRDGDEVMLLPMFGGG